MWSESSVTAFSNRSVSPHVSQFSVCVKKTTFTFCVMWDSRFLISRSSSGSNNNCGTPRFFEDYNKSKHLKWPHPPHHFSTLFCRATMFPPVILFESMRRRNGSIVYCRKGFQRELLRRSWWACEICPVFSKKGPRLPRLMRFTV